MSELPLTAATKDVIARYKRGSDMLESAALALRRLKERVDGGEPDEDGEVWVWDKYRVVHLQPHISQNWINKQLALAPPGATPEQVAENVASYRDKKAQVMRDIRERQKEPCDHVVTGGEDAGDRFLDSADSPTPVDHELEELIMGFNALRRPRQDEFLRRIGAARTI